MDWLQHVEKWKDCKRCPLCTQRDRICLGRGTLPCAVLFIGEAPGASEDAIGLPFKGESGYLLDKIIARSVPATVSYALTNLVACFPRDAKLEGTHQPHLSEIVACRQRVIEFVNLCEPVLIVCVGKLATAHVDHGDTIPCADIEHPAHILQMPRAQKGGATNKAIVTIKRAIEEAFEADTVFTKWGTRYASTQAAIGRRRPLYEGDDGISIPF